jgi:hypothetical protein
MSTPAIEGLGWIATGLFVGSYFFVRPVALRTTQIVGATLWVIYGALIGAAPVVIANVLVIAAAAWTAVRSANRRQELTVRTDA